MTAVVTPFPKTALPLLSTWAMQFPENNFDDSSPTGAEFESEILRRLTAERTWGVTDDGRLCGYVGFLASSHRAGMLRGVLLDREVHGKGVAAEAMRLIFSELFAAGMEKISAAYFAHNQRVHRFLRKLGAVEEGFLRQQAVQHGQPVDMRLVAFFKDQTKLCQ